MCSCGGQRDGGGVSAQPAEPSCAGDDPQPTFLESSKALTPGEYAIWKTDAIAGSGEMPDSGTIVDTIVKQTNRV